MRDVLLSALDIALLPEPYDMKNAGLTWRGSGIKEIDGVLARRWMVYHDTPDLMIVGKSAYESLQCAMANMPSPSFVCILGIRQAREYNGYINKYASAIWDQNNPGLPTVSVIQHKRCPDRVILFYLPNQDVPCEAIINIGMSA